MKVGEIEALFRRRVCDEIFLRPEGTDRYFIENPFQFDDGDQVAIYLEMRDGEWILTDEANTLMHLSYYFGQKKLLEGKRESYILDTICNFCLKFEDGEIIATIENEDYGSAFFNLVQALVQISNLPYISRDFKRSNFMEELDIFISNTVDPEHVYKDWNHPEQDRDRNYIVDYRINGLTNPVLIFGLSNDYKVLKSTITLYQFQAWGMRNRSIGIYEDIDKVSPKNRMKLSKICEKSFTQLHDEEDGIVRYLKGILPENYLLSD